MWQGSHLNAGARRCFLLVVALAALAVPGVARAATITVDTGGDGASGCTLRGAIQSANTNIDQHGCAHTGTYGDDTIQVPAGVGPTIQIASTDLEPGGSGTLTINGPGTASLNVRAASGSNHVFVVTGSPAVTIAGMTISHASLSASSGTRQGGGVYVSPGAHVTLDHVAVTGNSTTITAASGSPEVDGGGIFSAGALTIRDSTVAGNSATVTLSSPNSGDSPSASGGGIYMSTTDPLVIDRSTISGNTATVSAPGAHGLAQAGGVQVNGAASNTADIERSTISGNQVSGQTNSNAGGIDTGATGGTTLVGDTVTGNTASGGTVQGANLLINGATTEDTIVSNPHGGPNCQLSMSHSGGFNLEDANSCGFNLATDQVNVASTGLDPNLADNGAPTLTHALLSGSPAIDAGKSFGATTDQRGLPRPSDFPAIANAAGGDGSDIGAFEAQAPQHTLTVSKSGTGSGTVTSSPAGIDCGATCSAQFVEGTIVTLTASAASGSTFAGGSGGGCSGTSTCTVTMGSDQTVTASFTQNAPPPPTQHTLTVSKSGTGSGTITSTDGQVDCGQTCSHSYADGASVTLNAAPASGSTFAGWSGSRCSGTGTCQVTISSDQTVTATFTGIGNLAVPSIAAFKLSHTAFTVGPHMTAINARASAAAKPRKPKVPQGSAFVYALSRASTARIVIERRTPGRVAGTKCIAQTKANAKKRGCTITTRVGTLTRKSKAGRNTIAFSGRIGRKALAPASYRATITARAGTGPTSKPLSATFTIVHG